MRRHGSRAIRHSGRVRSSSSIAFCRRAQTMTIDKTVAEVRRRFSAAPEKVFAAFAEAELVGRWLKPAPEIKLAVLQFEFHVNGAYRFAYQRQQGEIVIVGGAFLSIEQPAKIVFSWIIEPPDEHAGIESEVTVIITPDGAGSELVIRHEKLTRSDAIVRHAVGWRGALDQLTALLEAQDLQHDR
ncbi:MAG: SRPBCC domain-containing protein [Mesorhizobium sp.]|nr:MAG: SRPBCC domain-containing protein [Mesorhizobium sp.]